MDPQKFVDMLRMQHRTLQAYLDVAQENETEEEGLFDLYLMM